MIWQKPDWECVCGALRSEHIFETLSGRCDRTKCGCFDPVPAVPATPPGNGNSEVVLRAGNGNPKDFVGASKAPLSTVSRRVMHELGLAMLEGECKYWRHNYRAAPVRAMIYLDALDRHLSAWIEGQDTDPDSGLSHLVKAMACLAIMRDAQLYGSLIDDRPPAQADPNWMAALNTKAREIIEATAKYTRGAYTELNRAEWSAMSAALARGPIVRETFGEKVEREARERACCGNPLHCMCVMHKRARSQPEPPPPAGPLAPAK